MTAVDKHQDQPTTHRPSFLDRQKDAALAEVREQEAERRRIGDLVLGANSARKIASNVIKLGDDYLVGVTDRNYVVQWTTVVNGKATNWYHERQEEAILHLIATRYDDNPNTNLHAAHYAARVLGIPTT